MLRVFRRETILSERELVKRLNNYLDKCDVGRAYRLALMHKVQRPSYSPSTLLVMFQAFLQCGDLPRANATKNEAMTTRVDGGIDIATKSEFHRNASMYFIARGQLDRANDELTHAREAFRWLPTESQGKIHLVSAYYQLERGYIDDAATQLDKARKIFVFESSESLLGREITWAELLIGVARDEGKHEIAALCYRVINFDPDRYRRRMAKMLLSANPGSAPRARARLLAR